VILVAKLNIKYDARVLQHSIIRNYRDSVRHTRSLRKNRTEHQPHHFRYEHLSVFGDGACGRKGLTASQYNLTSTNDESLVHGPCGTRNLPRVAQLVIARPVVVVVDVIVRRLRKTLGVIPNDLKMYKIT
jgi:hypothetical protein